MNPKITLNYEDDWLDIEIPEELIPEFKKLIHRALNTNADCHPAFKEFGDLLDHGRILQDYYSQRSDIRTSREGKSVQELLLEGTNFQILPPDPAR